MKLHDSITQQIEEFRWRTKSECHVVETHGEEAAFVLVVPRGTKTKAVVNPLPFDGTLLERFQALADVGDDGRGGDWDAMDVPHLLLFASPGALLSFKRRVGPLPMRKSEASEPENAA